MADEGNWRQSLSDKKGNYFGSDRQYYSGLVPGSTSTFNWIDFSGTNTGFGTANNVLSQRWQIVASGGNARIIDWSWLSGTTPYIQGTVIPGEAITQDGVSRSGVWIRSSESTAQVRVWAW
mgnify:CR=1 FL=1